MTFRYDVELRNAGLDARIKAVGPSPTLKIFGAPAMGGCTERDPDELLLEMKLPKAWMDAAVDGAAAKSGLWAGTATGAGKAKCFRIYDAKGKCRMQGGVPSEMTLDNDDIAKGQNVTVSVFVIGSGNG